MATPTRRLKAASSRLAAGVFGRPGVGRLRLPGAGLLILALAVPLVALGARTPGAKATFAAAAAPSATPVVCPRSLQSLINATRAGGTLVAPPCVYHERVAITRPMTLIATGATIVGDVDAAREWVWIGASNVTIDGLSAIDAGTNVPCTVDWGGIQIGGYWVGAVNNVTLRRLDLRRAGCSDIDIQGGSGHRILDSYVAGGGQDGITGSDGANWTIAGNRVTANNTGHYDVGDTAAGIKIAGVNGLTVTGNEVDHNAARGIWTDTMTRSATFTANRIHDNAFTGLFLESSHGLTVHDNAAWENGWGPGGDAWGWGGGITLSSSDHADIYDNTVAWNADGITVTSQSRTDDAPHVEIAIHDNTIAMAPRAGDDAAFALGWLEDYAGILHASGSNNHGTGNQFWYPFPENGMTRFAWSSTTGSLAAFDATGGDTGDMYISSSTLRNVLVAAGVPLTPQPR